MSSQFTIEQIREAAQSASVAGIIHAQIETNIERRTRELKPFLELTVRDLTGSLIVRVWPGWSRSLGGPLPTGATEAV